MENAQIAAIFDEIADLLELKNANTFRIRSYRNAAQTIRGYADRMEDLAREDSALSNIPNIGEATAAKIREILERGTCKRLEELREDVPRGLTDLLQIPGLGARKAMQLYKALEIESLEELQDACRKHKVRELEGMGEKTEQNILSGIKTVERTAGRRLYKEAADELGTLAKHLKGLSKQLKHWEVAGSFRRGKETIGDLDILVQAADREKAADAILEYEAIDKVIGRGKERVSLRLGSGLQVDFRFFDPSSFGSALMYFTGSKAHNIKVRRIAQENDWKLNEYGLFSGDRRLAGKTEKAVYSRLGMKWLPPEMREDRGEVELARDGKVPRLIECDDVHGDLQCHTTASDGKNSIKEMAEAARDYGLKFLAITDHSKRVTMAKGLDDDAAEKHADAIREQNDSMRGFWLLAGIEVDILKSGKLDLEEKTLASLDWVVASIHYDRNMSRKAMTDRVVAAIESGVVHCLGHPLGRIIGQREPLAMDMDRIFAACAENDVRIEINCQPERLDLPDNYCQSAQQAGVRFTLGTDAHSTSGLRFMPLGVKVARRGWLRKQDVLNTVTITELRKRLKRR